MGKIRHTIQTYGSNSSVGGGEAVISLAGCEFDIDDRAATAPRSAPIRGDRDWERDGMLRSADKRRDRG